MVPLRFAFDQTTWTIDRTDWTWDMGEALPFPANGYYSDVYVGPEGEARKRRRKRLELLMLLIEW